MKPKYTVKRRTHGKENYAPRAAALRLRILALGHFAMLVYLYEISTARSRPRTR